MFIAYIDCQAAACLERAVLLRLGVTLPSRLSGGLRRVVLFC